MSTEDTMSIEDRVRTATRARASLVRDIRPLPAPGLARLQPRHVRPQRTPGSRRRLTWGVPLAAAAAVVAVALSLVFVRQHGTVPGRPSPTGTQSSTAIAPQGIPRYYVATDKTDAGPLHVVDDRTGKEIATIMSPPGVILTQVAGTADDRTFVVTAVSTARPPSQGAIWYVLRIAPGSAHPYRLTRLPVSTPHGLDAALSPDGRELAVESLHGKVSTLAIFSVATGKTLHSWTTQANIVSGGAVSTLSWLASGGQVAFSVGHQNSATTSTVQVRAIAASAPGGDLLAVSRVLVTVPLSGPASCWSAWATPDGGTVVCATQYGLLTGGGSKAGCSAQPPKLVAYSVSAGQPVRVLYRYRGSCYSGVAYLLWADPSARHVIAATTITTARGGPTATQLGVISDGRFTSRFALPAGVAVAYYPSVAF